MTAADPQTRLTSLARRMALEMAACAHNRQWTDAYLEGVKGSMTPEAWAECSHEIIRQLLGQVIKPLLHADDRGGGSLWRRLELAAAEARVMTDPGESWTPPSRASKSPGRPPQRRARNPWPHVV